jgi:hypothetical protein
MGNYAAIASARPIAIFLKSLEDTLIKYVDPGRSVSRATSLELQGRNYRVKIGKEWPRH